ncbi:MAG: phosphatase PAP2 family protein [Helicobacter sp.]|nr:phosphatase PAP2 family protein [Helicobacter sp.]
MKIRLSFLFLFLLFIFGAEAKFRESYFEQLGDVLTLMPAFVGVVTIGIEDYDGALDLALGSISTQISIEIIKRSLEFAHKKGAKVAFAKRPGFEDYKGFPSGHSGGGFSAASFVFYRYGFKPAIAPLIGATLTAASRVYAKKHSLLQVIAGGAIAWGFGYIFTNKYNVKPALELRDSGLSFNFGYSF